MSNKAALALLSAIMSGDDDEESSSDEAMPASEQAKLLREHLDGYLKYSAHPWKVGDAVRTVKKSGVKDWGVGLIMEIDPTRRRHDTDQQGGPNEHQPSSVRVLCRLPNGHIMGYWHDPGHLRPWADKNLQ